MNIGEYQAKAHWFATGGGDTLVYALLGLLEEVGELIEKTDLVSHVECANEVHDTVQNSRIICSEAKKIRKDWQYINGFRKDDYLGVKVKDGIAGEIGDCIWMLANICHHIGISLEDVMEQNIAKLEERFKTNTICGSGETVAERIKNNAKNE